METTYIHEDAERVWVDQVFQNPGTTQYEKNGFKVWEGQLKGTFHQVHNDLTVAGFKVVAKTQGATCYAKF